MTIIETERETAVQPELDIEVGQWKMDPSLKQRWVTALRSGKYEQTRGRFRVGDSYCVLGVLCDVAGEPTSLDPHTDNYTFVREATQGEHNTLWLKNDIQGWTFAELADYIEANY